MSQKCVDRYLHSIAFLGVRRGRWMTEAKLALPRFNASFEQNRAQDLIDIRVISSDPRAAGLLDGQLYSFSLIISAMLFLGTLPALALAGIVFGARTTAVHSTGRVCGTEPSLAWRVEADKHFEAHKVEIKPGANWNAVVIPVSFHVVSADGTKANGNIPDLQIHAQIDAMNRAYKPARIYWRLIKITRTINRAWFDNVQALIITPEEQAMKSKLRNGGPETLNMYTVGFTNAGGLLGFSTYPYNYSTNPIRDGAVIRHTTLPGGTYPFDKGTVGVHEAGHWVGVAHPFDYGCDGGDNVADTPAEAEPALECVPRDSCPGPKYPGTDPIRKRH
ncbi:hypothetical protein HGRIS_004687 [Hohenbuehelia grisea]|uniref:Peptidase M43 pregnancy-associated plasma-A domain-containing protein n=1 Tax=Hohenbuehelia grisea TaxID=104357 RepID=A0ABR3JCT7_9AGAR